MLPAIATAVAVLLVFWGLATLTRRIVRAAAKYIHDQTTMMIVQVSYYLVWAVGFLVMFDAVGMNPESVATALGLGSVAIGFALKDILSNLVSGVLILAMRPFAIGDQIVIGDTEGTVEEIELRATQIRTYDGRLVLVPNGEVFTSRITNNTASPLRRASVYVYLGYKTDTGRALSLILDTVRSVPGRGGHACAVDAPAGSQPGLPPARSALLGGIQAHEPDEYGVGCSRGDRGRLEGGRHPAARSW